MMEQAKLELKRYKAKTRFVVADLGDAAWTRTARDGAPFDVIVSGYAIHHQPDGRKRRLYREIFELLRPGGLFVNMEHVAAPSRWVGSLFETLFIDSLHKFHRGRKSRKQIAAEFAHRPDKAANILAPVETQCRWLRACGFDDVDCYFKVFELAIFGGRRPR